MSTTNASNQWLFALSALNSTPSLAGARLGYTIERELYDRARGVEFLFRMGTSLAMSSPSMFTAATWFHRFYMRYSVEDYHRQDVAAACIFLSTKTEECGRKLNDVARVLYAKCIGVDISTLQPDNKEVEKRQSVILETEEVLLEALCFDFVVDSPHAELVDLFESHNEDSTIQEYAWSIAHDSYRTPLCILYPPRIIAAACHVLSQCIFDGKHSSSLDSRLSITPPTSSLPTPPTHKPLSPDASRLAIDHFAFDEDELEAVKEALSIFIEFYSSQFALGLHPHLTKLATVSPPTCRIGKPNLYLTSRANNTEQSDRISQPNGGTPSSSHGGNTPLKPFSGGWIPVAKDDQELERKRGGRLDLS